jgi:selenocysteine lyase/cysteine desulfurase
VPEEVGYILESSYDIIVRTGIHCAPLLLEPVGVHPWGTVRCSPSYFTTDEEIEKFIDSVKDITKVFLRKRK